MTGAAAAVRAALLEHSPLDAEETGQQLHRRRVVVAATLVVGAVLLGFSLTTAPGDETFYLLTSALAAVWAVGGLLSGRLHLGRIDLLGTSRRPVLTAFAIGLAAAAVFVLGALVVREIEPLRHLVEKVLDHARRGNLALITVVTVANGIAEEIFFRGALFSAIGRHRPVLISTVIYTVVTLASGNLMLTFAAASLGGVWGLQRRASGGVLASIITHVTWSVIMLFALPPLFN
ncbi:type II CAAX endopeptidase family protein [Jatrophihabitans sp.]|uniref:CPBP family intramembrane glutamic endopeptidase n=1 Tax=Jatrophihabitans sp. TaxID=1932789 RepID=UPI0030C7330C|nr:hypothetical protein [Jatrophihabitans sp.]